MRRLLLATPIALSIAFGLFMLMAWMINNESLRPPKQGEGISFQMVMVEFEKDVQRRQRTVPEQPKAPEKPLESAMSSQQSVSSNSFSTQSIPTSLGLNTAISGIAINAPSFGDFGVSQQALPLYRVEPNYPSQALKRRIEGYIVLRFTINELGKPIDIEVVEASPQRIFEREAIRALRNWKYQPKLEGGQAVTQPGQMVKLEFKLAK